MTNATPAEAPGISPLSEVSRAARIGSGTVIEAFVVIGPDVEIGSNCLIRSGAKIGVRPFARMAGAEADRIEVALHPVRIGDDCQIGNNVVIQYGLERPTEIHDGCWINNLCNIGHDIILGAGTAVGLSSSISGYSTIGKKVQIGPGCTLINRTTVGDKSVIGIGSLVLQPVPAGVTYMGRPAVERDEYMTFNRRLRELTDTSREGRPVATHRGLLGRTRLGRGLKAFAKTILYR